MTYNPFEPDENPADRPPHDAGQDAGQSTGQGADVVQLDAARAERDRLAPLPPAVPDSEPTHVPNGEPDEGDDFFDRETVAITGRIVGPPVDPPDETAAPHRPQATSKRPPIVPGWARTWATLRAAAAWKAKDAGYLVGYHALRSPKYVAKTAVYAPVGLLSTGGRLLTWATAEQGNWALRQYAADRNDPETWLKLDKQRQRQSRWRWTVLLFGSILALVGLLVFLAVDLPGWVRLAALAGAVPLLARAGRPADKPITDRVTEGQRYRKLTAELVRRALLACGIPGINQAVSKDPNAISFPQEIHRDGPGHMAIVDLPFGVEAADVIARRGRLASAMRLPLDQVWPEPGVGHPGRLALWVGYEPAGQMRQPAWPLLRDGKVDVFKPFPFATTPRMDVIHGDLMFRNWLVGGQPGSGKTFALRLAVLAAALDPRAELRVYELKGVGDFKVMEPVCTEYGNGFDDETIARCAAMLAWLYKECERRSKRIDHYAALGKAPENKVTPELASLKGSGLHPLIVSIDEIQELFSHREHGKDAGEICEKVIKLGRALGVVLLIGTQIPDKDSLPTGITRNVNTRYCMSVADQVANDMILGTSMYKNGYRATVFEPKVDAGWGILTGIGKPAARRSFFVDSNAAKQVVARAIALRVDAGTMPEPDTQTRTDVPSFDLLADLAQVWPAADDAAWNELLCSRLAGMRPEVYGGWKSEQLTAALKPHGVKVGDIGRRIDGKPVTRRGIRRDDLTAAIAERNRRGRSG
ncbi:FtsK/SpoIIIE domain-containing protein [Planotetraspora phitsanulokensis]|uniref:Cell division protein FtsK n=1 Tax=Planotetraspora phitsanulokensis TaxID=575192 RepID=A0A8J3U8Z3_9ACTN|nr:cell division protein FtsK [Planotetraspora phitsanulokensis]GII40337.1 cell division protein FtsK [Planotetraspora phitsanulokensis]